MAIERATSFLGPGPAPAQAAGEGLGGGSGGAGGENPRYLRWLRVFKDQDPQFENITGIELLSFDGKDSRIKFDYESEKWPSAKAAAESMAPSLGLPVSAF